jgi:large subunit ribosomal protein L4
MELTVYSSKGQKSGSIAVADEIFGIPLKQSLVHEVIVAQDSNSRRLAAHVKDRGEVAGTGKKPWKQKGTGRARHGHRRSPIWSGGGITFGPNAFRNFFKKVNKKVRRKAVRMVLSDRARDERFLVVEGYEITAGKTKDLATLRAALPGNGRPTLFVTALADQEVVRAAQNLPRVETIAAHSLNAKDLTRYEYIVASKDALDVITNTYKA